MPESGIGVGRGGRGGESPPPPKFQVGGGGGIAPTLPTVYMMNSIAVL